MVEYRGTSRAGQRCAGALYAPVRGGYTRPVASISIRTALVLAGGRGERLRPLTDDRPKPMVPVNGVPILEHHLRWLRDNGIARAVLLTGYRHEAIDEYFASSRIDGLDVETVVETSPLGRGGALRNGFEQAGIADDFVVGTNGDVLTDQPLAPLIALHAQTGALATLMLTRAVSPFGVVEVDELGLVRGFVEKPRLDYWINAGAYILSAEAFARFPAEGDHETSTFPELAEAGRLAAYRSERYWKSVESAKDLREAGEYLAARPLRGQDA